MDETQRPGYVYRRETTWVKDDQPSRIDVTFDTREWDEWVDTLVEFSSRSTVKSVKLFAAPLNWGHDLMPQLLHIVQRERQRVDTEDIV